MPAGLQVINNAGILQIDENFRNLCFRAKGTTLAGSPTTVVLNNCVTPILAFGGDFGPIGLEKVSISGSTYTYTIWGSATTYYHFDVPPTFPLHGVGLQVWDAAGDEAFDSNLPYMKPVDKATYTQGFPGYPPRLGGFDAGAYTKGAGDELAFAYTKIPWFIDADYPTGGSVTLGIVGFYWSGNDLWGQRSDIIVSAGVGTPQTHDGELLLIDVSGL